MTSVAQETWDKLTKPTGDKLLARLALPDLTQRLFCAIDVGGVRHLLLSLKQTDEDYHDQQSRGVSVITNELVVHGEKPGRYLDIACIDAGGNDIFDLIGGEIAIGLVDGTRQPSDIVSSVLAKWRRFWGQLPQPMMSREEQLGLFAELWFLFAWLLPNLGCEAVLAWRGPWGSRHDFEWTNKSVEVKATTSIRGRIHHIHGLSQLEKPENGDLYLFSVGMHEESGAANSLQGMIESCRSRLVTMDDCIIHFENALVLLGYSPMFEEEYNKMKLRITDTSLFRVDDDFPKLTQESFLNGISEGIEKIDYEINLNTYNHLIIASQPDQLSFQ